MTLTSSAMIKSKLIIAKANFALEDALEKALKDALEDSFREVLKDDNVNNVMIKGHLQTEIPEGMTINSLTFAILKKLEDIGAVSFEGDSGSDWHEAQEQLRQISEDAGYIMDYVQGVCFLLDEDKISIDSSLK